MTESKVSNPVFNIKKISTNLYTLQERFIYNLFYYSYHSSEQLLIIGLPVSPS